jgi:AcrR family transcriptional regulator
MPQLDGHALPRRRRGRPVGSDSAETRNRILRAARQVINERGYQAATFQAIAITAGLSRPTLHYYFATREEIFETLVGEASHVIADCIAKAQRHGTLVEQLSALVAAIHEADYRDRSTFAFLVSARLEASRNPELSSHGDTDMRTFLTTLVAEAVARGELRADIAQVAVVDMLHSMLWGVGFYAGFVDDAADMFVITKQLSKLFSEGLLGTLRVP